MKVALTAAAVLVVAFIGTTWWALEAGGVAIVHTGGPEANLHRTHVWYVEPDGDIWLEAGTPDNGWYRDVLQHPALRFEVAGRTRRFRAAPVEDPQGHERIRALIRAKYGFRDRWVNALIDTSESVAVRLVPDAGPARAAEP